MHRRRYLQGAIGTGAVLLGGCLGRDDRPTVLDPLHDEDRSFPTNGDELPSVEVPAPLHDTTVAIDGFVGERETLFTFVFTRCPGPCHTLTSTLAHVQAEAINDGYTDEVALMPTTFDPEHDTPDVLAEFCRDNGADPLADNWYALRPDSPDAAQSLIQGEFGLFYDEVAVDETDHDDHGHEHGDHDTTFQHANLLVLANRDGFVERSYFGGDPPTTGTVLDDLETVRDAYG